jgi:hypothetical protein
MIKKTIAIINLLFSLLIVSSESKAQCDTIASVCSKNFTNEYLSDGQEYRALLVDEQTAEFHLTLYGGSAYRFGVCSGLEDGNITFRVLDQEYNELFSNQEYQLAPYWDFKVESTLDVIVEANLNLEKVSSGCAVLLVGFKP